MLIGDSKRALKGQQAVDKKQCVQKPNNGNVYISESENMKTGKNVRM